MTEHDQHDSSERATPTTAEILASARVCAESKGKEFMFTPAGCLVSERFYDSIVRGLEAAYLAGYDARLTHERSALRAEIAALEAKHD